MEEIHVLNLGAGVQSTFLYLAFMRGLLGLPKLDAAIFADTGDEPGAEARELGLPDTPGSVYAHLDWLKSLGGPRIYGGQVGILSNDLRDGRISSRKSANNRFAAIPALTTDGVSEGRTKRQCSKEYKIEVIGKVLRRDILGLAPGRSPKGVIVHQYIGFSLDEAGRAGRLNRVPCPKYVKRHFPLVENFITRANCAVYLNAVVPHEVPRSACVECPFHSDDEWLRIKSVPLDWQRAVRVDESLRTTGSVANRDMTQTMYLHRTMQPLVQIEFKPSTERGRQSNINFAPECMGVCRNITMEEILVESHSTAPREARAVLDQRGESRGRLVVKRMAVERCTSQEAAQALENEIIRRKRIYHRQARRQRYVTWQDELRTRWKV